MTLIQKLRYMGRQYAAGQASRGGRAEKHYLEEAAVERAAVQAVTKFVHIAMHGGRLTVAEKDAAVAAVDAAMRALEGK